MESEEAHSIQIIIEHCKQTIQYINYLVNNVMRGQEVIRDVIFHANEKSQGVSFFIGGPSVITTLSHAMVTYYNLDKKSRYRKM